MAVGKKKDIILIEQFPAGLRNLVQRYADQRAELVCKRAIATTCDIDIYNFMLVLIEQFGCGTVAHKGQKSRLQKALDAYQNNCQYFGGVFGQEMLEGLKGRLESYGVHYDNGGGFDVAEDRPNRR